MQVGDQVKLVGIVKEMVTDKNTSRVSVLLDTVSTTPGYVSHEVWVQAPDLVADTQAAAAAATPPATPGAETGAPPHEAGAPPTHQSIRHSSSH